MFIVPGNIAVLVDTTPLDGGKGYFEHTQLIMFEASVDIDNAELVPIQSMNFVIYDSQDLAVKNCTFKITGSPVSGCGNMSISPNLQTNVSVGDMHGYGTNPYSPWQEVDFDIGYGYGDYNGLTEFNYTIGWNATLEGTKNGNFSAILYAIASDGNTDFVFSQSSATPFTIMNQKPVFTAPVAPTGFIATEDQQFVYDYNANDSDGDTIKYFSNSTRFRINSNNGTIFYTPVYPQRGNFSVKITASDGTGTTSRVDVFEIREVNDPPLWTPLGTVTVLENSARAITTSSTDEEGATVRYGLVTSNYTGNITVASNGQITFPAISTGRNSTFFATINITDGTNTLVRNFSILLVQANSAPVIQSFASKIRNQSGGSYYSAYMNSSARSVKEIQEIAFNVSATDPEGDESVTIKWFMKKGTGSYEYKATGSEYLYTPDMQSEGSYTVRAEVSDGYLSASGSPVEWELTVLNFLDTDGDGIENGVDACPLDASNTCGTDRDSDGILGEDGLVGDTTVIDTTFSEIKLEVGGSDNLSQNFTGQGAKDIVLAALDLVGDEEVFVPVIEIPSFDFSSDQLDLTNLSIKETEEVIGGESVSSIVVDGLDLGASGTKTVYMKRSDMSKQSVCIKDDDVASISEVTSDCSGTSEYKVECDGTEQHSLYTCTYNSTTGKYKLAGLRHSGIFQISYTKPSTPSSPGSSSSSSSGCSWDWECGEWTACADGVQTRECVNKGSCGAFVRPPETSRECEADATDAGVPEEPGEAEGQDSGQTAGEQEDTGGSMIEGQVISPEPSELITEKRKKPFTNLLIGIAIIIIILFGGILMLKTPPSAERHKQTAHKLNEKARHAYRQGNMEKANRLARKAEEYRLKSIQLSK